MTEQQQAIINQLKTLQGHLGGVIKMIESGSACEDILIQMKAIASSVARAQSQVFEHYLSQCTELSAEDELNVRKALKMIL